MPWSVFRCTGNGVIHIWGRIRVPRNFVVIYYVLVVVKLGN